MSQARGLVLELKQGKGAGSCPPVWSLKYHIRTPGYWRSLTVKHLTSLCLKSFLTLVVFGLSHDSLENIWDVEEIN